MRLLLTNDDGINSPGLFLLAAALRERGHRVFIVAPSSDQSGVSHAISFLRGPRKLSEVDTDTWICEGTPVDCVVTALLGGIPELAIRSEPGSTTERIPPDAVISGINRGANLGTDITFSGTAAAARQGALFFLPSLALSLIEGPVWNWDMAVIFVVEQLAHILSLWKPDSFLNINIPNKQEIPSALVHAFPSLRYYNDRMEIFHAPDGCTYCFPRAGKPSASFGDVSKGADPNPEEGSDWDIVSRNNASVSEICIHPVLLESVRGRGEG